MKPRLAIAKGNTGANAAPADPIDALYERHLSQVKRWARQLAGPAADLEDLVHDIFLVAFRKGSELGISGLYSTVGGWVPGGSVEFGWLRRDGWWGLRAWGAHQAAKSLRVDIGDSPYDRTLLGAALVLRWERPRIFLSSDWGLAGALTRAHGDGYSQNQSASGLNVGLAADGRVGLRLGRCRVWADVRLYRWLAKETVQVDPLPAGPSSTSTLPTWDAHLGLGAGVVFD